jgi:hypothetical protein
MGTSPKSVDQSLSQSRCSLAASRARISARPENEPELKALAQAFGLSSPGLLGSLDPDSCSLKTYQVSLFTMQCDEWSESWPDSGMWGSGSVYELQTSELPTFGNEYSLWPTVVGQDAKHATNSPAQEARHQGNLVVDALRWPTARQEDGESCGNHPGVVHSLTGASRNWAPVKASDGGADYTRTERGAGGRDLKEQVQHWKTPHVMSNRDFRGKVGGCGGGEFAKQANQWQTPGTDSFRSRGGDRKDEMGLDQQSRHWPTAASKDYRTPNLKPFSQRNGKSKGEQLQNFVEHRFDLLPGPQIQDGPPSSQPAQTSRRRLNPRFVEWLMGFPIGWTEL